MIFCNTRSSRLKKNRYFFTGNWPLELWAIGDHGSFCSSAHRTFVHLGLSLGQGGWAAVALQTPRTYWLCRNAHQCQVPHCLSARLCSIDSQLLRCPSCFLVSPDKQKEPYTQATALPFQPCLVLLPESLWCYKKQDPCLLCFFYLELPLPSLKVSPLKPSFFSVFTDRTFSYISS